MSEDYVTRDLMRKLSSDVSENMLRTISLVENRQVLPIVVAAGASCVGIISGVLHSMAEGESQTVPDPECILLAALLVARTGIGGDDPIGDAYRDLETIKAASPVFEKSEGKE